MLTFKAGLQKTYRANIFLWLVGCGETSLIFSKTNISDILETSC